MPIVDPRVEYFIQDQNLNGFVQNIGPQGTSINAPIVTFLNPDDPFITAAQVLASAQTGWGMPQPAALTATSGTITTSGVGQQIMAESTDRTYLLIYSPGAGFTAVAQNGAPTLGIPASTFTNLYAPTPPAETGTVIVGTGQGLLQNALATPPAAVWTGSVWILGLQQGQTYFAWQG